MEAPVAELVGEFVREVRVAAANSDGDMLLQSLVDAFQSSSAMSRRDMRRMLEKGCGMVLTIVLPRTEGLGGGSRSGVSDGTALVEPGAGERPD